MKEYPYNYHEDRDNTEIKPCLQEMQHLMENTLGALNYLKKRKLTNHVKVINLRDFGDWDE